jgi:hypothetical protein
MTANKKYSAVQIPTSSHNLSKAAELQVLRKLAEAMPAGSYLQQLFSVGLLDWFNYQSSLDFCCDLHHFFDYEQTKRLEQVSELDGVTARLVAANSQIAVLEGKTSLLGQQLDVAKARLQDKEYELMSVRLDLANSTARIEDEQAEAESLQEEVDGLQVDLEQMRIVAREEKARAADMAGALEQANQVIVRLQELVFRLEHPELQTVQAPSPVVVLTPCHPTSGTAAIVGVDDDGREYLLGDDN